MRRPAGATGVPTGIPGRGSRNSGRQEMNGDPRAGRRGSQADGESPGLCDPRRPAQPRGGGDPGRGPAPAGGSPPRCHVPPASGSARTRCSLRLRGAPSHGGGPSEAPLGSRHGCGQSRPAARAQPPARPGSRTLRGRPAARLAPPSLAPPPLAAGACVTSLRDDDASTVTFCFRFAGPSAVLRAWGWEPISESVQQHL